MDENPQRKRSITNFNTASFNSIEVSNVFSVLGTSTVNTLEVGSMTLTNPLSSALVTNGTADTVAIWGPDKRATNLANGTGMLTNNNAGVLGWMAIPTGGSGSTQMVTFAAGTATITNAVTIFGNLIVGTNLTVSNAMNIGTLNATTLNATNMTFGKSNWFPVMSGWRRNCGFQTLFTSAGRTCSNLLRQHPQERTNSLYTTSPNISVAYANGVTNNSILRTNTVTPAGSGIVIRQDGAGGITISNTVSAASGEANVNGEVSVTNATRIGWVYDKNDVTNRLRS